MKSLPSDSVLSYPWLRRSTADSRLIARTATFDFVSRDSRGCTEGADSTVIPLRVSLVEPVAYVCDS